MAVVQGFRYRAIDPRGGAVVKGTLEAASEAAVTSKLRAQGLTPLEVIELSKTGLHMGQWLSLPMILLGAWLMFTAKGRRQRVEPIAGSESVA